MKKFIFLYLLSISIFSFTQENKTYQEFDTIPSNSKEVFLKLQGGGFEFYPIYLKGSQPFITPNNIVYTPLELLEYIFSDGSTLFQKDIIQRTLLVASGTMRVTFGIEDNLPKQFNINGANLNVEPLWFENDVYLPTRPFLNALGINTLWDPVLNILTVLNTPRLNTFSFYRSYASSFNFSWRIHNPDNENFSGISSGAAVPKNFEIKTLDPTNIKISITALSLPNLRIGVQLYEESGSDMNYGKIFNDCNPSPCTLGFSVKINRNSTLILVKLLVVNEESVDQRISSPHP